MFTSLRPVPSAYIRGVMTEVPEYLLERSRERRAALGLGGGGSAAPAAAPTGEGDASPAAAAPASAPAAAPAPSAPSVPIESLPTYVAPVGPRSGIPVWMMPVILILPLWAIVYLGAFGESTSAAGPAVGAGDLPDGGLCELPRRPGPGRRRSRAGGR